MRIEKNAMLRDHALRRFVGRTVHFEADGRIFSGIVQGADNATAFDGTSDTLLTVESLDRFPGCKTLLNMRSDNTHEYGPTTKVPFQDRK